MDCSKTFEDLLFQQQTSGAADYYESQASFTFAETENESSVDACIVHSASSPADSKINSPESHSQTSYRLPDYTEIANKPSKSLQDTTARISISEEFKGINDADELRRVVHVFISSPEIKLFDSDENKQNSSGVRLLLVSVIETH